MDQHSSQEDEEGRPIPSLKKYVPPPFPIYLLEIFSRPESHFRKEGYFNPPWFMTFYQVPFNELYVVIRSSLPGLIAPEEKDDAYASFHITDSNGKTLCRLMLRGESHITHVAQYHRVELFAAAPEITPAAMLVIHQVLQGIGTKFGNAGEMRITHTSVKTDREQLQAEALGKSEERGDGPTERTRMRYEVFKKLKDAHPTWSQDRVAQESHEELGEIVTASTVRNTYRLMNATWERGDRVR